MSSQPVVAAELDNIYAGVASIPDTLNYLEGYFDDYDYDLEQLFEDAAAVHGYCLTGPPSLLQAFQDGLKGMIYDDNDIVQPSTFPYAFDASHKSFRSCIALAIYIVPNEVSSEDHILGCRVTSQGPSRI